MAGNTFKERVRSAREAKNYTKGEVAEHLGMNVHGYVCYENMGQIPKSEDRLNSLADFLGVPVTWLLYGDAPEAEPETEETEEPEEEKEIKITITVHIKVE